MLLSFFCNINDVNNHDFRGAYYYYYYYYYMISDKNVKHRVVVAQGYCAAYL